jgi:hypothetical protein
MTSSPDAATDGNASRRCEPRPALPARLTPQTRPTPTIPEATAQIATLRTCLRPLCSERADLTSTGPDTHPGPGALASAILAPGGLLDRYERAAWHAAHPPHGLEQAWGLVAATLAVVVTDLAALWADRPESSPTEIP